MNNFKNKILELRKKKNYTQEDLANILHVSRQAISKWENGISFPSIDILYNIAHVFNVSIEELFDQNDVRISTIKNNNKIKTIGKTSVIISIIVLIVLIVSIIGLITANKAYEISTKGLDELVKDDLVGFLVLTDNTLDKDEFDITYLEESGYPFYIKFYDKDKNLIYSKSQGLHDVHDYNSRLLSATIYVDGTKYNKIKFCHIFKSNKNDELYIKAEHSWNSYTIGTKLNFKTEEEVSKDGMNFDINIISIDTLTSIRVLEYDLNNEVINEKILTTEDVEYIVSKNCLYIVLENKFITSNNEFYYNHDILTTGQIKTSYFYSTLFSNDSGFVFTKIQIKPTYFK